MDGKEKTKKNIKIKDNTVLKIVVLLLIISIISPYILTRESFVGISFEGKGEIGDVIGGTTAPFINLIAAILVFVSFRQQVAANENQTDVNEVLMKTTNHAYIEKLYNDVITSHNYLGSDQIFRPLNNSLDRLFNFPLDKINVDISDDIDYSRIYNLLNSVEFLILEIENHIKDEKMKNFNFSKLALFLSELNILSINDSFGKIDNSRLIEENNKFYKDAEVINIKVEGLNSKLKLFSKKNQFFVF